MSCRHSCYGTSRVESSPGDPVSVMHAGPASSWGSWHAFERPSLSILPCRSVGEPHSVRFHPARQQGVGRGRERVEKVKFRGSFLPPPSELGFNPGRGEPDEASWRAALRRAGLGSGHHYGRNPRVLSFPSMPNGEPRSPAQRLAFKGGTEVRCEFLNPGPGSGEERTGALLGW